MRLIGLFTVLFLVFFSGFAFSLTEVDGSVAFITGGWECVRDGQHTSFWRNASSGQTFYTLSGGNSPNSCSFSDFAGEGVQDLRSCCPEGILCSDYGGGNYTCAGGDGQIITASRCTDISEETACNIAPNSMAKLELDPILSVQNTFCGDISSIDEDGCVEYTTCHCGWKNGACTAISNSSVGGDECGSPHSLGSCSFTAGDIIDNCEETGKKVINYSATVTPTGASLAYCKDTTQEVDCFVSIKLPFFGWTSLVLVIIFLVAYYFWGRKKDNKKKKK
jgi:hypothetical protein